MNLSSFSRVKMGKRGDSYRDIWVETQTGDILDDAIWSRNATIEDKFNVKIVEKTRI